MKVVATLGGLALLTACQVQPPAPKPVVPYDTHIAVACNNTKGYAGPERCGSFIAIGARIYFNPAPAWEWSYYNGHGGATTFKASNP